MAVVSGSSPARLVNWHLPMSVLKAQLLLWLLCLVMTLAWPHGFLSVLQAGLLSLGGLLIVIGVSFRLKGAQCAPQIAKSIFLGFLYKFFWLFVGIMAIAQMGTKTKEQWLSFIAVFSVLQIIPMLTIPFYTKDGH